jgi:hypothetical protein
VQGVEPHSHHRHEREGAREEIKLLRTKAYFKCCSLLIAKAEQTDELLLLLLQNQIILPAQHNMADNNRGAITQTACRINNKNN